MTHTINNKVNTKIKEYFKKDDLEALNNYISASYPNIKIEDIVNQDNDNLLHLAVFYEAHHITEELIKKSFNLLNQKNKLGRNPLFEAVSTSSEYFQFFLDTVKTHHNESFDSWVY